MASSPLLNLLESVHTRAKDRGTPVLDAIRAVAHSPVTAAIVAATPTPFDDLILGFIRAALPAVSAAVAPTS